jgi:uncharacterized SAM-binding protein YcdF (DUF218 family)
MLVRKERWGLSWRGRLVVLVLVIAGGWLAFSNLYSFFAITRRVDTPVLVVEGWVHEYAIRMAVDEFRTGSYRRIYTTGGPVQGVGRYINDYSTAASVGAGHLKAAGMPPGFVQMVPSRVMERDRTYNAAVALRDWLRDHGESVKALNVLTEDVHARRTRLLFQQAFGDQVRIGIISAPNPDYDARYWWRYSEGVRTTVGECIAYTYARVFFLPD